MKESPNLGEFKAWRNENLLGIKLDTASVEFKARGYREFKIAWRDANSSDLPQNYTDIVWDDCIGKVTELVQDKKEFKPKAFPCVVKMTVTFLDGTSSISTQTIK